MGNLACCEKKPASSDVDLEAGQQNPTLSDVGASDTSLPLVADSDEQKAPLTKGIKASNEDFHLSLPQYETPESEFHQKEKSLPGSYSSLDELCGRKKNKSKISKKLFGEKDNDESERELDEASKVSTVNIPNGKETTLKEYEVDIEICPIEHAPDKNEPDIDIYPLDQEVSIPVSSVNGSENKSSGSSKGVSDNMDGISAPEIVMSTENHVDSKTTVTSCDKQSASDELYKQVMSGRIDVTIPNMAKIVRIFTSSTFTDTRVERNALMNRVYPKLREFCHEHGYEFHVVDMRWGVHDPCTDDHSISEISLKELRTCQELSTGPNFVTFLCQKYGYRPFPHIIPCDEFESLLAVIEDENDKDFLDAWFKRDDNAVPAKYVLQPISSQFPDFVAPTSKEAKQQALREWWNVFLMLQSILRKASEETLSKDAAHRYQQSDSEEEIKQGILQANCPNSHAFWFHRIITDMKDNAQNHNAAKYIDMEELPHKENNRVGSRGWDDTAKNRLESLKKKQIPSALSKNNIISYNLKWVENGIDTHSSEEHHRYIEKLCQDFYNKMKGCIEKAIKEAKISRPDNILFEEVSQHTVHCKQLCSSLNDQNRTLNRIKSYVTGEKSFPLVVHGQQGSGKTSLVAMAASKCSSWVGSQVAVVLRFIGTTLHSSKVQQLLQSICHQLCVVFNVDSESVPKDYQNLVKEFHRLLQNATATHPLVLFLDSLDQLHSYNITREMSWLPCKLPPHVKIVLSCLTGDRTFAALKAIATDEDNFVEVPDFTDDAVVDFLKMKLNENQRKLTESQENFVLKQVSRCPSALCLKLAVEQAVLWRSYTAVESASLASSVREMINSVFENLERKHGRTLLHHTLAYITASRKGISETELEDVLSCDDKVLDDVFSTWAPPIRRLPPSLLSRIKADIDSFLAMHVENGVRLMTWKHQQVHDVVIERYLFSNEIELHRFHSELADYFIGRWTQGAKKEDTKGNAKDRHVSPQPLKFSDDAFNYRKLSELPYHLLKSDDFERLKRSALCNYEFLLNKLKATSVYDVLDDFVEALAVDPDELDVKLVFETLQLSIEALNVSADQLASQLIGRLSSSRSPSPFIARLLRQAHHPSNPSFVPNIRCLARPGGRLVHSRPGLHGSLVLSQDGKKAMNGGDDQLISIWDVKSARIVKTLDTARAVGHVDFCLDDQLAVASCQGALQFWNLDEAEMVWEIPSTENPAPIAIAGIRDTLVAVLDNVIKFINLNDGTLTRDFVDQDFNHDKIAGLGDNIVLASSRASYTRLYDLQREDIRLVIEICGENAEDFVSDVILTPFHRGQLLVSTEKSCGVRVFELISGKCLHVLGPDILYPTVTKSGRYLLCTDSFNDIAVWNLETAVKEKQMLKHPPTTAIVRIACVDLKMVVTVSDDLMARVWDLEPQGDDVNFENNKDKNSIQQLVLIKSSFQKQVITKSKTPGPICVWNLSSCQVIRTLNNTNADEVLVVDETRAVIRSGTKLALIDLQEGKLIKHMRSDFPAKTDKVHRHASSLYKRRDLALRLAESPRAVSTSVKFSDCALVGTTHVLILSKDRLYLKLASLETGELVTKLKAGQDAVIETVMVSGNGLVAVCSCENAPLIVWDLREKSKRYTLEISGHYPRLTTADISSNGHYLVDVVKLDKAHKSVVTWDLETGKVKHIIGQGMKVWKVASSCLSMRMVVAGTIGTSETIRVYDLVSGAFYHQLNGHTEPVKGVCLSKDGKRALSFVPVGVRDRTIRLWDLLTGTLLASFTPDLPVSNCILTDDGDQVVMVINKSRPIVSLTLSHEVGSRELSVDVSNPYFSHPTLHGAVFDMSKELEWEDEESEFEIDV